MAVLFWTSCGDHQTAIHNVWDGIGNNVTFTTAAARTGLRGINFHPTVTLASPIVKNLPARTELYIHFAFRINTMACTNSLWRGNEGTTNHVELMYNAVGALWFRRAGTNIGTILPSGTLQANRYYSAQVKVVIHDSAGVAELKLDGVTTGAGGTGLDTRNGATGVINQVRFGADYTACGGNLVDIDEDDIVVDDAGYLGDVKVQCGLPVADSPVIQWVRGGTDSGANWSQVDENAPNSDTDYNSAANLNDKDLYQMTTFTGSSVVGVGCRAFARKMDPGTCSIRMAVRSGGSDYDNGGDIPLSETYAYESAFFATDPHTGAAWTLANLNAARFGPKRVA